MWRTGATAKKTTTLRLFNFFSKSNIDTGFETTAWNITSQSWWKLVKTQNFDVRVKAEPEWWIKEEQKDGPSLGAFYRL